MYESLDEYICDRAYRLRSSLVRKLLVEKKKGHKAPDYTYSLFRHHLI